MCRKNIKVLRCIQENEGIEIAKCLKDNKNLEKLELEGNLLGPKTASEIGSLIKNNQNIRFIDLEFNNLTAGGTINDGIKQIAEVYILNSNHFETKIKQLFLSNFAV
jgi:hypothetical protein